MQFKMMNGDWDDDVVWTNAAYSLSALGAWGHPVLLALMAAAGTMLAVGSATYHAVYERWAQRLDVATMMTYLASTCACVLTVWTLWALLIPPVAAVLYWRYAWDINTLIHVPAWSVAIIAALWVQVGWIALGPLVPAAIGGVLQRTTGTDSLWHSGWHIGGAGAVAWVLYLI